MNVRLGGFDDNSVWFLSEAEVVAPSIHLPARKVGVDTFIEKQISRKKYSFKKA